MSGRYWIHDSLTEDQPDIGLPFGDETVGIVDEQAGGVILYLHQSRAQAILDALRANEGDDEPLLEPDARFPERPHTLDLARLSSALHEQDAVAEVAGLPQAMDVDPASLTYMAKLRIQAALLNGARVGLHPDLILVSLYFDAFQLGVGFQNRGGHRPDETGNAGEGRDS